MAEYLAIPSQIKLHSRRRPISNLCFLGKHSLIKVQSHFRFFSYKRHSIVGQVSWNERKQDLAYVPNKKLGPCLKYKYTRYYCLGTLTNADGFTPSDWIPFVNQALLMTSIFLTHMAGAIPHNKAPLRSPMDMLNDYTLAGDPTFSGSAKPSEEVVNLKCAWELVEVKLMNAVDAVGNEISSSQMLIGSDQDRTKQPLSLYAIAEVHRLRLLCATFQGLKEEVDNMVRKHGTVSINDWCIFFSEIILKSCKQVYMSWLGKELCLKTNKSLKELFPLLVEKIRGDDTVLQNIKKSSKENLYAELTHFLAYGSLGKDCCYNSSLFIQHGASILEDLIIGLADGVASIYLELISVDGTMLNEMNSLGFTFCTLSTRELQKLRNEVAVNTWLHQNTEAIVSMYEDRFDLRILQSRIIEEPTRSHIEDFNWWKKLTRRKSGYISSPPQYLAISYQALMVRRTQELRALTGWQT
ncbi:uncharacterized protein LOC124919134 isoform X2 [Impatiens glandulifera]|uniref:uncharacterized protein LOC124919134 isoform X2 n=1 Tax=Impatiens glandulifera TaxID=253017 RepID=UPI001FB0A25D|nr:uncharacterized protein LOC124919134 isoform X2 [Impatiens glandulifera]